jgi:hypothetical protein
MAIDTKKATRRTLAFNSFDDVRTELTALEKAHAAGALNTSGNWTPGQILSHLAAFMTYPYDGYPPELSSPPWFIKLILKAKKNTYLYKALPAGVKIPGIKGGTTGADDVSFEQALPRLLAAMARMEKAPPAIDNPVFGPMTHDQWKSVNIRHCELHLAFFRVS